VRVTLLGPQRRPTLNAVVRSLGIEGPIATTTAGWQEREPDDDELKEQLDGRVVNLGLYGRWLDVQDRDPGFSAADRRRRQVLEEMHALYLLRLDHALQAVYAVQHRRDNDRLRDDAVTEAVADVRTLDAQHLRRIGDIHDEFYRAWPPHDRPVIAEHRAAVARLLGDAATLVIAGGHVGVLASTLHLFNVAASLRSPVIAWSAGAMALTDRIVLFHDRSPQGPSHPELYDRGLSVLKAVVPLPHARARLVLDDLPRMAVFARRFAPARCILLEAGTRIDTDSEGSACPPGTRVLAEDGRVTTLGAA
jgi:hypothetical protein